MIDRETLHQLRAAAIADDSTTIVRSSVLCALLDAAESVLDAPLAMVEASADYYAVLPTDGDAYIAIGRLGGKRVRLVRDGGE